MARTRRRRPRRKRVGRVSYYQHHGAWWIYYRDGDRPVRRRIGDDEAAAQQMAALTNAQLTAGAPTAFSFSPISVVELRRRFLDYHEHVAGSSLATVKRYRAATQHLEDFVARRGGRVQAHEIDPEGFVRYLRTIRVAPNGHPNTPRRKLRDKGKRFILEVCRSLYAYAAKKRHLPPYSENPFASLGGRGFRVEDPKPVFVFDAKSELAFLQAADDWAFPVHFTLAKTGIRPGELVHLLIEDLDLDGGWMHIRNKPELGWRIKTGRVRSIPLVEELTLVLRHVIGERPAGPVFLRQRFEGSCGPLASAPGHRLGRTVSRHVAAAEQDSQGALSREQEARIARRVWLEAGAVRTEAIRQTFIRTARLAGLENVTCPKSWRHSFATLLQEASVDPLVRQITLGHAPAFAGPGAALGTTTIYTHTRPETQRREILRAVQLWPHSLEAARAFVQARGEDLGVYAGKGGTASREMRTSPDFPPSTE
jgi:integrase